MIGEYACVNGECVPQELMCDGHADCVAGDDELMCQCTGDQVACLNGGRCISRQHLCDGFYDCYDRSDEENVLCRNNTSCK